MTLTSDPGDDATYAIGETVEATVTFSVAVNVATEPRLTLDIDVTESSSPNYANYDRGSGTAALVLSYTVEEGDEDTDGIAIVANSLVAHNAPTAVTVDATTAVLTHLAVPAQPGHKVDGVRPAYVDGSASVNGATLTLSYDEALYEKDAAATGGFTVTVAGASRSVNTVAVDGTGVTLTLASAVTSGQVVTLDYTPGSTPIRDLPGNGADGFTAQSVTNNTTAAPTPTVSSVTLSPVSPLANGFPGYAINEVVEATVTFSVAVTVTSNPRLFLDIGGTEKNANYSRGSGTTALVFHYTVAEGDEDTDGIAIAANKLTLPGRLSDVLIQAGSVDAILTHPAVAADPHHRVDGVRPDFVSASVNGATLTLRYDETLFETTAPSSSAFTVTVGGTTRGVNTVAMDGTDVTLTLA